MDTTTTIIANDHCLHAMDIDTHPYPQARQRRPHFSDKACELLTKEKILMLPHLKCLYLPEI